MRYYISKMPRRTSSSFKVGEFHSSVGSLELEAHMYGSNNLRNPNTMVNV